MKFLFIYNKIWKIRKILIGLFENILQTKQVNNINTLVKISKLDGIYCSIFVQELCARFIMKELKDRWVFWTGGCLWQLKLLHVLRRFRFIRRQISNQICDRIVTDQVAMEPPVPQYR